MPLDQLREVSYADYWNDERIESEKEWWVLDGDFERMEDYLERTGLSRQLDAAVDLAALRRGRPLRGAGVDVAAGNLWAVPRLLARGASCVYAVEYSSHRLQKLGPAVLRHYGVARDDVVLCLGSFYDLRLPDGELDFVLMSQALHHADDPGRLLVEARRVLRPDGVILVIGEHVVHDLGALRRVAAAVLRRSRPANDPVLGDHFYSDDEYERLFVGASFAWERLDHRSRHFQGFVLTPTA
jgi:SAM-dependent methyltransferase